MTKIAYLMCRFIRAMFFWIPQTETEIAVDRMSKIIDRKERLQDKIFSGKFDSVEIKETISELLKLTEETKLAMLDNNYIKFDFEIAHRKEIVVMCDILISDLKGVAIISELF